MFLPAINSAYEDLKPLSDAILLCALVVVTICLKAGLLETGGTRLVSFIWCLKLFWVNARQKKPLHHGGEDRDGVYGKENRVYYYW